jgi:hypothetical protein
MVQPLRRIIRRLPAKNPRLDHVAVSILNWGSIEGYLSILSGGDAESI